MSGARPLVSVVMTTRNRARFLPDAVRSVLEQSFGDHEVVVSDNCSADDTPAVARGFGDPRVRYVRTPAPLGQPDAWEFALGHARGRYLAFLADDDALCADGLRTLAEVVSADDPDVVAWNPGFYYYDRWYERRRANSLELFPGTGELTAVDSRALLRSLFGQMRTPGLKTPPLIITSAYSADVVERVRKRNGRLFLPIHADIAACLAVLTQVPVYVHLDDALSLRGKFDANCSYGMYRAGGREPQVAELGDEGRLRHVSVPILTLRNLSFETMLRMKALMPDELGDLEIEEAYYFVWCYRDLMVLRRNGVPVAGELEQFWAAVARLPAEAQSRVRAAVRIAGRATRRQRIRRIIERYPSLAWLERWTRPAVRARGPVHTKVIVRGAENGFGTILECARTLDARRRAELARFWRGERPTLPVRGPVVAGNPWDVV